MPGSTHVPSAALFLCLLHINFGAYAGLRTTQTNVGDDVAVLQQPQLVTRRTSPTFRLGKRSVNELSDLVRRTPTFSLGERPGSTDWQWPDGMTDQLSPSAAGTEMEQGPLSASWEGFQRAVAGDVPESGMRRRAGDEFMTDSFSPTFRMGKRQPMFRLGGGKRQPTFRMGKRAPLGPSFRLGGKRNPTLRLDKRLFEGLDAAEVWNNLHASNEDADAVQLDIAKHPSQRFIEDDDVTDIMEIEKIVAEGSDEQKRSPMFRLSGKKRSASPTFRLGKREDQ